MASIQPSNGGPKTHDMKLDTEEVVRKRQHPPEMTGKISPKPHRISMSSLGSGVSKVSSVPSLAAVYMRDTVRKMPWANIHCFCASVCLLITVHGCMASGYVMGVISTIEKNFELRSQVSGLILSSYEVGSLISVLFVSYFGSHGHIPKWIGAGALVLATGASLMSIPHFVTEPRDFNITGIDTVKHCTVMDNKEFGSKTPLENCGTKPSSWRFVGIFIAAEILLGIGGSPLFTLGTTYIDNNVPKDSSSIYLAFMYMCAAFGPVLGFGLGAVMLSHFVDPPAPEAFTSSDPTWIGMWWGGFIICGLLYFMAAIPFFGFPRKLSPKLEETIATEEKSVQKIPQALWVLIRNPIYMIACLLGCTDLAIVAGFLSFLTKYLETQFGLSKSIASIATGGVAVPGACMGIALGGWILNRWKLQMRDISKLVVVINFLSVGILSFFFAFGCPNPKTAGVFENYEFRHPYKNIFLDPLKKFTVNLTSQCNVQCRCTVEKYSPVCGVDGKTYFSPCHAGCQSPMVASAKDLQGYSSCGCISVNLTGVLSDQLSAYPGVCANGCVMLAPFLALLFLLTLVASVCQTPLVMIVLRSVAEKDKAFSLGFQVVMLRIFSYIPAPIAFGSVIDTTCLVWKESCGEKKNCLIYDIEAYRFRYGSLAMALKLLAVCLSLLLLFLVRRKGPTVEALSPPITMSELARRFGDAEYFNVGGLRSWRSDDQLYHRPKSPGHKKTFSQ